MDATETLGLYQARVVGAVVVAVSLAGWHKSGYEAWDASPTWGGAGVKVWGEQRPLLSGGARLTVQLDDGAWTGRYVPPGGPLAQPWRAVSAAALLAWADTAHAEGALARLAALVAAGEVTP